MKQTMNLEKRTVIQVLLVVLFVAVSLFFALLTVLSLIPERSGLTVREEVVASSARLGMDEEIWRVEVRGRLRNTSDTSVTMEKLTVTVKGSPDTVLELSTPVTIAPREDFDLVLTGTADHAVEGSPELTAVLDGRSVYLRNPAYTPLAATVFPLAFAILFTVLSVRAIKVLLLLCEERKRKQETAENG